MSVFLRAVMCDLTHLERDTPPSTAPHKRSANQSVQRLVGVPVVEDRPKFPASAMPSAMQRPAMEGRPGRLGRLPKLYVHVAQLFVCIDR